MKKIIYILVLVLISFVSGCNVNVGDEELKKMVNLINDDINYGLLRYDVTCASKVYELTFSSYGQITKNGDNYKLEYYHEYLNSLDSDSSELIGFTEGVITGTENDIITSSQEIPGDFSIDIMKNKAISSSGILNYDISDETHQSILVGYLDKETINNLFDDETINTVKITIVSDVNKSKLIYYSLDYETNEGIIKIKISVI